ncbi:MAG: ribonuclease R [Firmicutes bacterium]|nr:ribonuclease R [Bacillota bacterium]
MLPDQQDVLLYMQKGAYNPQKREELEAAFLLSEQERAPFYALLAQMEEEALIVRTRTQRYGVPERMDLVAGSLQVKSRGFGFVVPLREGEGDLYVSATDLAGAMDGDRVLVRPKKVTGGARREGEIIRVVKRARQSLVGTLTTHGGFGFVQPDDKHLNQDIFIPGEALRGAVDGQKVVIGITAYPGGDGHSTAAGEVLEILGFPNDPGVDILAIVRKFGLAEQFPREVLDQAEQIPHEIDPAEIARRRDLRAETIVTIDGADAKDLDDAVHVRKLENGNTILGVHIADVSYYVREGSALDREAFDRGTSVYLVDRVIPMLPPRLSNGICSLHPMVDRLTLTCEMEWSAQMELVRHDIYPSVIKTTERMTYDEVRGILTHTDEDARERYAPLIGLFEQMQALALKLRSRRMARGAIDFDFAETKIKVDENGAPLAIIRRERSIAEMMIEEFMLAANETIAEHFYWLEMPFLYRIHEAPASEKMISLNEYVHHFGYHIKAAGGEVHPRTLQGILEKVKGRKEETVISHLMLRSMRQARYSQESLGHFGLATEYYSHFTSPIRRYPDLMIHRIIREHLLPGGVSDKRRQHLAAIMPEVASHCSGRERNAVDAERETDLVKKIEYMKDKVGEEFEGMISGVTGFGLFVELDMLVEGLIHVSYLEDDYYHYHENVHALIGERTKRTFRIGDRVRVRVQTANKENLTIDFSLVEKIDADDIDVLEQAGIEAKGPKSGGWGRSRTGGGSGTAERLVSSRSNSEAGARSARSEGTRKPRQEAKWGDSRGQDERAGVKSGGRLGNTLNADLEPRAPKRSRKRAHVIIEGEGAPVATQQNAVVTFAGATKVPSSSEMQTAPKRKRRRRKSGGVEEALAQIEAADPALLPTEVGHVSPRPVVEGAERRDSAVSSGQTTDERAPKRANLLPSKGGYANDVAAKFETPRERKQRERQALREIAQSYGVQVKDKRRRERKEPK